MSTVELRIGPFKRRLRQTAGVSSGLVSTFVGLLVILGWWGDIEVLKSGVPGLATMKFNTALCFVLAGPPLILVAVGCKASRAFRGLALAASTVLTLVALLTLAEYVLGVDLAIDELLIHTPADESGPPGRMAPVTALNFLVIGTALLLVQLGRLPGLVQSLALGAVLFSTLCCLSYLYGFHALQSVAPFSSVAIHTAATFLIVSLGLVAVSPDRGLVGLMVSSDVDGTLTRRFLPPAIVVPILMVWLQLAGHRSGWYELEFGLALGALTGVVFCSLLVVATALTVQRAAVGRKAAELALQDSEQRYRLLLEGVPQLVWTCLPDGRCDYLSPQWVRYTGAAEAGQLGYGWLETVHPDDRAELMERWGKAVRTGQPFDVEFRLRSARGEYRWFKTRAVLFSAPGEAKKWFGTNTDIQDQRLAEDGLRELNATLERRVEERTRALRQSETQFRAIFNAQFQFIGLMSLDGVLLEANQTALTAVGATRETVVGKPFWETAWWVHDPFQQQRLREAVPRAASGEQVRFETTHPTRDGSLIWVDFSLTPFRDEQGDVVLLIPEGRDITRRKLAEEALREQEERFRGAFEDAPIGMALVSLEGKWLRVNRSLCELVGYSEKDLLATDLPAISANRGPGGSLDEFRKLLDDTQETCQMEDRLLHRDGGVVQVLLSGSLVRSANAQPLYFIAQMVDITRIKDYEEKLAARDALLRQFIKYAPAAIAMFDRDLRYLQASDRWLIDYHLTGTDLVGRSHHDLFPDEPEQWKAVHQRVLAGTVERGEEDPYSMADGSTEWLQWECRPWHQAGGEIGGLMMFTQVVTARRMAAEQLKASLREKEVLLKEIHHRVKNNLQIVSTLLELQSDHTTDPKTLAMFEESRGRVKSMALIHESLYRSDDMARVDFAEYIRKLTEDLWRSYRVPGTEISLLVDARSATLPIDVAIPCALILNELLANCFRHAFSQRTDGSIRVSFRQQADANTLSIADNGTGFPAAIDFRATSSLGLQLVNTLVEQLRGEIELDREHGTRFTIRFTCANDANPAEL